MMRIDGGSKGIYLESPSLSDLEAIASLADERWLAERVALSGDFPHPYTVSDAAFMVEAAMMEETSREGFHLLVKLSNGSIAGSAGLYRLDYGNLTGEAGIWIGKQYRNRGLAGEAMKMLLKFGFHNIGLRRVMALSFLSNTISLSLFHSLGFRDVAIGLPNVGKETVVMALQREEYLP